VTAIAAERGDAPEVGELWPLPEGWAWVKVGDVTSPVSNVDPRKLGRDTFTYIDLSAIEFGRVESAQSISAKNAPSRAKQRVEEGDTLFSCVRVYLKNIAFVTFEHHSAVASTAYCVLRPRNGIDSRYLFWFVNWQKFISWAIPLQRGNSPPAILEADVKNLPIPVPPLAEQRRIVARIDELFAEIAEGEAALERARSGLETWRRALLKAAIAGELTRDWRKVNGLGEDGFALLDQIIQSRKLEWHRSARAKRQYREPYSLQQTVLADLPMGWAWTTVDELTKGDRISAYGVLQPGPDVEGGVPMVRVGDINCGRVRLTSLKRIAPGLAEEFSRTRLSGRELLITLVGAIGRTAIVPDELAGANTARAVGVVPLTNLINVHWVELWFRSPSNQIEMVGKAHEVARKTLNLEDVRSAAVALPPRSEQDEIVRIVSDLLAVSDEQGSALEMAAGDFAVLRQSILKSTFEGRLICQDPSDEPASILLARIRAESPAFSRARGRKTSS
jgi:type I restriction enzyme S subunit